MKDAILKYFEDRFGIKVSPGFKLYTDQKGRVFLGPHLSFEPVSVGMQIATIEGADRIRPSTSFLQLFGKHATKNYISLTKEQTQAYAKGDDLSLNQEQASHARDGYVLLKYLEYPLGCGLLKTEKEGSKGRILSIRNVLPKARRMRMDFL